MTWIAELLILLRKSWVAHMTVFDRCGLHTASAAADLKKKNAAQKSNYYKQRFMSSGLAIPENLLGTSHKSGICLWRQITSRQLNPVSPPRVERETFFRSLLTLTTRAALCRLYRVGDRPKPKTLTSKSRRTRSKAGELAPATAAARGAAGKRKQQRKVKSAPPFIHCSF